MTHRPRRGRIIRNPRSTDLGYLHDVRGLRLRRCRTKLFLHDVTALYDYFVPLGATSSKSFFMFRVAPVPRSVDLGFLKFDLSKVGGYSSISFPPLKHCFLTYKALLSDCKTNAFCFTNPCFLMLGRGVFRHYFCQFMPAFFNSIISKRR